MAQTTVANLALSSVPHPQVSNPGATYGTSETGYGVGGYGSGITNVNLKIRAKFASAGDAGVLRVWLYEGSILREGPFDITLTNTFTTYIHNVVNAASILNWSNLNIQVQGIANTGATLTSQISWLDIESVPPTTGVFPKVGGGKSIAKTGGTKSIGRPGGLTSVAKAGGIELVTIYQQGGVFGPGVPGGIEGGIFRKVGGGIGLAVAGGFKSVSQPGSTFYSKSGGGILIVISGGNKSVTSGSKTGGAKSNAIAGGSRAFLNIHTGGGTSKAVAGGVKLVTQIRIGGTISAGVAGTTRTVKFIKTSGGTSNIISGSTRLFIISKKGGGISTLFAGGSKTVHSIITTASKIGGAGGLLLSGGTRGNINIKIGGVIARPLSGGTRTTVYSLVGGGISQPVVGGKQTNVYSKFAGAVSIAIAGVPHTFVRNARIGGGISNSIAGGIKTYISKKKSGAGSPGRAGGNKSKIIIVVYISQFGGATIIPYSGTTKKITSQKIGGTISTPYSGITYNTLIVQRGGSVIFPIAGITQTSTVFKFGGAKSKLIGCAINRNSTYSKSGGSASILNSGTVVGKVIVNIYLIGGATSTLLAGGSDQRLIANTFNSGAKSIVVAGGTKIHQDQFETLGAPAAPILSAKLFAT